MRMRGGRGGGWVRAAACLAAAGLVAGAGTERVGEPGELRTFKVRRPSGEKLKLEYRVPPQSPGFEWVPGVREFEVFPKNSSARLIELLEEWAAVFPDGWNRYPDSVDGRPMWEIDLYEVAEHGHLDKNTQLHPAFRGTWPMVRLLCNHVLNFFVKDQFDYDNQCDIVFLRKYSVDFGQTSSMQDATLDEDTIIDGGVSRQGSQIRSAMKRAEGNAARFGRKNYPAHQDRSFFTFNIQLSDIEQQEGGQLWACEQFPQSFVRFVMHKFFSMDTDTMFMHSLFPMERMKTPGSPCRCVRPEQGHTITHRGGRLHGVEPLKGGTRYTMIIFFGRGAYAGSKKAPEKFKEPYGPHVMDALSREDMRKYLLWYAWVSHGLLTEEFPKALDEYADVPLDESPTPTSAPERKLRGAFHVSEDMTWAVEKALQNKDRELLLMALENVFRFSQERKRYIGADTRGLLQDLGWADLSERLLKAYPADPQVSVLVCALMRVLPSDGEPTLPDACAGIKPPEPLGFRPEYWPEDINEHNETLADDCIVKHLRRVRNEEGRVVHEDHDLSDSVVRDNFAEMSDECRLQPLLSIRDLEEVLSDEEKAERKKERDEFWNSAFKEAVKLRNEEVKKEFLARARGEL